jgi:hypothetical protein
MGGLVLTIVVLAVVMAATIAVALFVLRRVGDRAERRADDLRDEVARLGEGWVLPLSGAVYESGPGARGNRGHGVLGLTGRRLLFLPIAGDLLSVPRVRLAGACVEDRRRDAASSHRHRLVLTLDDASELAFLVDEPGEWVAALEPSGDGSLSGGGA